MGCVLCNLIQISEKEEPFPDQNCKEVFMNELAVDIAQYHPELVQKINEHARKMGMAKIPKESRIVDIYWFTPAGPRLLQIARVADDLAPSISHLDPLVGLVIAEDPVTREKRGFIGIGLGQDEKADIQYIADWGSPVPPNLFSWLQKHLETKKEVADGKPKQD